MQEPIQHANVSRRSKNTLQCPTLVIMERIGVDPDVCSLWAVGSPVVIALGGLVGGCAPLADTKDKTKYSTV